VSRRLVSRAAGTFLIAAIVLAPMTVVTEIAWPSAALAAPVTPRTDFATHAQISGDVLVPGTTAIVQGDGQCVRMRSGPSLSSSIMECLSDGRTVLVLPSVEIADGYRWQLVEWRGIVGWMADEFLEPHAGPPETIACSPSTTKPGLTGSVPSQGGFGLAVWGGGTLQGIQTNALTQNCQVTGVWAGKPGGGMVGYRFGAPAVVNRDWHQIIGSSIAAGTPLLVICEPVGSAITSTSVVVPAPVAPAPVQVGSQAAPKPNARAAVVIDEASGAVLYEYNAYDPLPPASLTKIVTAILALEGSDPDSWVHNNSVDYRKMPGSSVMGVIPGDCFTMKDMLYGLMLPSGNDAALAIGRHMAGSDEAFVNQMNTLMTRLGLTSSRWTDPHGLGGAQHRTTAYDIAMLSRYAMMQLPLFVEIVNARSWTAVGDRNLSMFNVNSFMSQSEGGDGVKTGFTSAAGRTLSASATRDGRRVYAVVMNDNDRYADADALITWAFDNFQWPD